MKRARANAIVFCLLVVISVQARAINCKLAESKVEKVVCASRDLTVLDDELNHLYRSAVAKSTGPEELKSEQKRWLSEVQATCIASECINSAYVSQLARLREAMLPWCKTQ
jgi:uncharacterized protein